jgi:hypothetical protein
MNIWCLCIRVRFLCLRRGRGLATS